MIALPPSFQYGIPPGGNFTYRFGTENNYGAYWYHVHVRGLYQDGLRGPLLIYPASDVMRPFSEITNVSADLAEILTAEQGAPVVMIHDWFHDSSEEIMARLGATNDSMMPLCSNSILFNGKGRVTCPAQTNSTDSFGCESMNTGMRHSDASASEVERGINLVAGKIGQNYATITSRSSRCLFRDLQRETSCGIKEANGKHANASGRINGRRVFHV